MKRDEMRQRVRDATDPWDLVVIGGGSTGLGIAVDAATRNLSVLLLEQSDFGKGTSSRSTKLIHGGVRYLRQGNIALVRESLREREVLRRNAPHLVHDLTFLVPAYAWWEKSYYGLGMKVYDTLAGSQGFGKSSVLSASETQHLIPTLVKHGLRGGVRYHDGQFDDARLVVNLAQTAVEHGAVALNYCPVIALNRESCGRIAGVTARDDETGEEFKAAAHCVINATGAFSDRIRRMDEPNASPTIAPSQGVHLVFDRRFLPGNTALMVPRTPDNRLLFVIPWQQHVLVGTTDTPIHEVDLEPRPLQEEIAFLLETASGYLDPFPKPSDILSTFVGIRPLVDRDQEERHETSVISREHSIRSSVSGLLTIAGGKWTTYRQMAEDCVDRAIELAALPAGPCVTSELPLHGAGTARPDDQEDGESTPLAAYGTDAEAIAELARSSAEAGAQLHSRFAITAAQVIWAARHEMARSVDDVLARRTRVLHLDARAALEMADPVARVLAAELGRDEHWITAQVESFHTLAHGYLL